MILQGLECSRTCRIVEKLFPPPLSPFPTSLFFHVIVLLYPCDEHSLLYEKHRYHEKWKGEWSIHDPRLRVGQMVESSVAVRAPKWSEISQLITLRLITPNDQVSLDQSIKLPNGSLSTTQNDRDVNSIVFSQNVKAIVASTFNSLFR